MGKQNLKNGDTVDLVEDVKTYVLLYLRLEGKRKLLTTTICSVIIIVLKAIKIYTREVAGDPKPL